MPLPDRSYDAYVGTGDRGDLRRRALEVLTSSALAYLVDLVAWKEDELVHVAAHRGHVTLSRANERVVLDGVDPVGDQDEYCEDGYPFAHLRLHSLFDEARAPDLAVVHQGAHHWPERGGHLGEHGSLNARQSRAPLLLAGAGVTARGTVERVVRTVDVGATLAHLAGGDVDGMDGRPVDLAVPTGGRVAGLLWDGTPCGSIEELPNVRRLLERGCTLRGGAVAEFPSVTLVNHTSALTGLGPGQHGIVNNAYFDRATREQVIANSSATWHGATGLLRPGVRTVFERVPGTTACVNDPVDQGADYSTFDLIRAGGGATAMLATLPDPASDPDTTHQFLSDKDYAWSSQVDAAGLVQALEQWSLPDPPSLMWWNTTLTDSAHHAGGPGSDIAAASLRDSDSRLGVWLDLLTERGLLDTTTIVLTADHGMERADEACTGDWDEALTAAGIPFRDEAYGFLYLGA
ncbi:MAG TPA: alkaline phosphatase family protein [Mycobacteriales bacterium]|nr:alkaline phosphatase family protein [Mycobacteriales bacterium]